MNEREKLNQDYSNIIYLPHHVSTKHPHMDILDRAAQFAPFAALTGYDDMIDETGNMNAFKEDSVVFCTEDLDTP